MSIAGSASDKIRYYSGTSIAASPAYTPSIFHSSQVLLGMFHISLYSDEDAKVPALGRILLPTTPRDDSPWTLGLASLVLEFVSLQTLTRANGGSSTTGMTGGGPLPIYLSEDLAVADNETDELRKTCFERLLIVGSLELSAPFLATREDAALFRSFSYSFLGLNGEDDYSHHKFRRDKDNYNSPLRVTVVLRPASRWILNLDTALRMLRLTGLVDEAWLDSHVLHLDNLTFREQVSLMRATDILISPHGAALQNLMFMEAHSAIIELFTSPWYEPGYQANALVFDLHYQALACTNFSATFECAFPASCLSTPLLVHRRSLECYGIRQCHVIIDVDALEVAVWQASQSVRILKRNLNKDRGGSPSSCSENDNDTTRFYKKAYHNPLS